MNDRIYSLIEKILDSNLPMNTKDEIVRFYMLPRNTPVRGKIEIPDEEPKDVGTVTRPSIRQIERKENPTKAATEDAMTETLEAVLPKPE